MGGLDGFGGRFIRLAIRLGDFVMGFSIDGVRT